MLRDQGRFDVATWDGIQGWLNSLLAQQESRGFSGGCPLGSLVAEVADQDDRLRTVAAAAFMRWEDELATGLRALQEQGGLCADADPETLAEEALASIQGGYLLSTAKRAGDRCGTRSGRPSPACARTPADAVQSRSASPFVSRTRLHWMVLGPRAIERWRRHIVLKAPPALLPSW